MRAIRGKRTTLSLGYTLAEMLSVVLILAVSAAAILPSLTQSDKSKVELAASEVAGALRFAREEARRRSAPTVVVLSDIARVQVFELDVSDPLNPTLGPPLYHPLNKDAYDRDLHILPFSEGVQASSNLPPGPPGAARAVGFDARGEPLNASNLASLGDRHVDVSFGSKTRRVLVTAFTARITEAWQ